MDLCFEAPSPPAIWQREQPNDFDRWWTYSRSGLGARNHQVAEALGGLGMALAATVADGGRVTQIIDNLIANALDILDGHGGRVTVELRRPTPARVSICVIDTGPGVPPDMVDRLFEPFFTTRKDGTGLGLFLSAEMARALGGDLRYGPAPGGGAAFEVRLPC